MTSAQVRRGIQIGLTVALTVAVATAVVGTVWNLKLDTAIYIKDQAQRAADAVRDSAWKASKDKNDAAEMAMTLVILCKVSPEDSQCKKRQVP